MSHSTLIVRWKNARLLSSRRFPENIRDFGVGHSWVTSIHQSRRESLNTAAISREGYHTARGPSMELWFPYAPITHLRLCPPVGFSHPSHSRTTPQFSLHPSQTISVGHFWLLIDVDLLIRLARARGETWARCVRVCRVDSGEIWWTIS